MRCPAANKFSLVGCPPGRLIGGQCVQRLAGQLALGAPAGQDHVALAAVESALAAVRFKDTHGIAHVAPKDQVLADDLPVGPVHPAVPIAVQQSCRRVQPPAWKMMEEPAMQKCRIIHDGVLLSMRQVVPELHVPAAALAFTARVLVEIRLHVLSRAQRGIQPQFAQVDPIRIGDQDVGRRAWHRETRVGRLARRADFRSGPRSLDQTVAAQLPRDSVDTAHRESSVEKRQECCPAYSSPLAGITPRRHGPRAQLFQDTSPVAKSTKSAPRSLAMMNRLVARL